MAEKIGRLLTAMLTPFDAKGRVEYELAQSLATLLVEDGSDGVIIAGTTGEGPTVTDDEKIELVRRVRAALPGADIVAGTGTNDTHHSVELSRRAMDAGADALLCVVPYYSKPPQEGMYQHFKALAGVGPVIMYNIQGRTATNMSAATTLRAAELANVIGVKEASGNIEQMSLIAGAKPDGFELWSGDDGYTLPLLAVGGYGVICVVSHIAGRSMKRMIEAFLAGDTATATKIHLGLTPVINALMTTASNPVPIKSLVNQLGFPVGPLRLPLTPLPPQDLKKVMEVVEAAGDLITFKAGVTVA